MANKREINQKIKIGALYGRVSVDEAAEVEHGSLEQQKHMGVDLAESLSRIHDSEYRIKYYLIEDRGVSGGNTNRPKYRQLLDLIRSRKIDFLIAKEVSRLCRSTRDFCDLMELCRDNGVAVHIRGLDMDPQTATGEMVYKVLATIAEFERKLIVQRTKDSIRSAALNNAKINGGSVLLGFDRDPEHKGFRIPNPSELKNVIFLMKTFVDTQSYKCTLDAAAKYGITNKGGSKLNHEGLKRLLTNSKYVGKMKVVYGTRDELEKWVDLPHGPVVPIDLFQRVQDTIKELEDGRSRQNRLGTRVYLLTGLLQHEDESKYRGLSGTSKTGDRHYYYWNEKNKISINAEKIEDAVLQSLKQAYENDEELDSYLKDIQYAKVSNLDIICSQIQNLEAELRSIATDDGKLLEQLKSAAKSSGTSKAIQWLEQQVSVNEERKLELETQILELQRDRSVLERSSTDRGHFRTAVSKLFHTLTKADPVHKRGFLRQVFKKIEVCSDNVVKISWGIPACDSGGLEFFSGNEWGG